MGMNILSGPAWKRIIRWTPTISVALTTTTYTWVTLQLTLPEAVDWNKTVLRIDGKSFYRQVAAGGTATTYGLIWRPGTSANPADPNTATIYCKCGQTGTKSWTPECELWILDSEYSAYHLYGNWDTTEASGAYYTQTATCGDAAAAARAILWLVNMDYDPRNACICNDAATYISDVDTPHRDVNNNSCLYYKDTYGNSNVFYSFTYAYKK